MPLTQYDFYLDAGADWQKIVRLRDPNSQKLIAMDNAVMEVRNSNYVLVMRLDGPSSRCYIDEDDGASIHLHITAEESYSYFAQGNYPGTVQAVGIWGIGRSYIYDLFCTYATGVQDRVMRGFFYVDPNISQPSIAVPPPEAPPVTVMAEPETIDLTLYAGDDFWMNLTVTNPTGSDADLTGYTASAQIRTAPGATGPPMCVFDTSISGNVVSLHLPASEAAKLSMPAAWDCQIVGPTTTTLAIGTVSVIGQITP